MPHSSRPITWAFSREYKRTDANVGSAIDGCHLSTGNWLATTVERRPVRSSMTSSRSRHASTGAGESKKSSRTKTLTRANWASVRA